MADVSVVITPLIALILGAVRLGGGIYETLLVDRAWPGTYFIPNALRFESLSTLTDPALIC